jgi:hypothetical protein
MQQACLFHQPEEKRSHNLPNHTGNHTASTNNHSHHTLHPNHSTNHNEHLDHTTPPHDHPNIEPTQHTTKPHHSTPLPPPPPNNSQFISPTHNNTPQPSDMSIATSRSPSLLADDDELASQNSIQLSIIINSHPPTLPTASHKRNRPSSSQSTVINPTTQPPLFIQFNTPLQSNPTEILTELATALGNASTPQDSISSTL